MNFLVKLILDYVLDYLRRLVVGYFKKEQKKKQSREEILLKKDRVKKALDSAHDGEPITKEQRDELYNSYRDLIRG